MFLIWYLAWWGRSTSWGNTDGFVGFLIILTYAGDVFFGIGIITSILCMCMEMKDFKRGAGKSLMITQISFWVNVCANVVGFLFHFLAFFILAYWGTVASGTGNEVGAAIGGILLVFALAFLLNSFFFLSQLCYTPNQFKAINYLKTRIGGAAI
jgi:hypothetical protein